MTKVLIIDDEPTATDLLQKMLINTQFEVTVVNSGSEGVELARQLKPDVIVLDLMMPGMNGWEACREIRAFSQAPILILSAVTGAEGVMRTLSEGANDYLVKPVPRNVLISHLRMLTEQTSNATSDLH